MNIEKDPEVAKSLATRGSGQLRLAHRWYRDQVVTLVDDHDQCRKWTAKWRFCGDSRYRDLAFNVMATQLTTAGIRRRYIQGGCACAGLFK